MRNDIGETPLHTLVRKLVGKDNDKNFNNLWSFLVYCNSKTFDINVKTEAEGNTALHLAAEVQLAS